MTTREGTVPRTTRFGQVGTVTVVLLVGVALSALLALPMVVVVAALQNTALGAVLGSPADPLTGVDQQQFGVLAVVCACFALVVYAGTCWLTARVLRVRGWLVPTLLAGEVLATTAVLTSHH